MISRLWHWELLRSITWTQEFQLPGANAMKFQLKRYSISRFWPNLLGQWMSSQITDFNVALS